MKPITRKEMLMAKAAGQDVPDITPVTREEYFLSQISGGGGGGGGGGSKVYELTQDTVTQTFTLHATYNEVNADLATGYPLVVRKTTREVDGVLVLDLDLFAIIGIAAIPDVGYMCAVKGIVTNEQQTSTIEMSAASPDEYFVGTFDD